MPELQNVPEVVVASTPDYLIGGIAALFILYGVFTLLFPQTVLSWFFGAPRLKGTGVLGQVRALMGALPLALGASYIVFGDQPVIALMLTVAICAIVIGRFISMLFDRSFTWLNALLLLVEIVLAALAINYIFNGFLPF